MNANTSWGSRFACNMNAGTITSVCILCSALALIFGMIINALSMGWPKGDEHTNWGMKMNKLAFLIRKGATSLFGSLATYVVGYSVFMFLGLLIVFSAARKNDATDGIRYAAGQIVGVAFILIALFISMINCSEAFTRTARAAMNMGGVSGSLRTAFSSGCVASFVGMGLGLFGLCTYFLFMTLRRDLSKYHAYGNRCSENGVFCAHTMAWQAVTGYVFGISAVSVLVRGFAGIFGKAAEVGSELIHKLEPEASMEKSKNPAGIADKVGANIIDCAANMVCTVDSMLIIIVSAGLLAQGSAPRMAVPFWVGAAAFLSALIAYAFVRCSNAGVTHVADRYRNMMWGLRIGMYICSVLTFVFSAVTIGILYSDHPDQFGGRNEGWRIFACIVIGIFAGLFTWEFTSFFTASGSSPTRSVAAAGITGASTMLIQGLGIGLLSVMPISAILIVTIIACAAIFGQYGIAMGALGFATLAWFSIAASTIQPVAYAADSCVDQPETAPVREVTVALFMAGESCAAESRGWNTALAVLTGFSALMAFRQESGLGAWEERGTESDVISEGFVFANAVCGAFLPIVCAGINTLAIGKATRSLVDETRRQFQMGVAPGQAFDCNPEAVSKSAAYPAAMGALLPAFFSVMVPICIGFLMGPRALSGFIAGAIVSGAAGALFLFNSGATWVKSKTSVEAEGAFGGSGSDAHIASVIGTRTGSAMKDVAAPTMISCLKTASMTALLIAPLIYIDRSEYFFVKCLSEKSSLQISVLSCFDWNKAYWATIPFFLLALITAAIYFAFWAKDGTPAPRQQAYDLNETRDIPPMPMAAAPMMMTQAVPILQQPMPVMAQPQFLQSMAQPQIQPQIVQNMPMTSMAQPMYTQNFGHDQGYMVGGMRPEMASVDNFMQSGYNVAPQYGGF
jgi:K(+)-stimulated pyrophosphate-energized sodium pump